MPTHLATAERTAAVDNETVDIKIPLIILPNQEKNVIIINYPGYNGDINGYNNKYRTLGEFMREKIGAVVMMGNQHHVELDYEESVRDDLQAVIEYAIEHSVEICNSDFPEIYLMGYSAGASAIAAVAYKYEQVKKVLLLAPSYDATPEAMIKGLAEFTGDIYIASGADDRVVGADAAPRTAAMVKKTVATFVIIQNCDHQFRGRKNGLIMSNAPIWAFLGGINYPSIENGIVLYE